MKKVYYLSTCDTCKRIMNTLNLTPDFELQDLKKNPVTAVQVEDIKIRSKKTTCDLLNKRAQLYRQRNLKEKTLSDKDCEALILEHYSFLKRPIFIIEDAIFVGNAKKTVDAAKEKLDRIR